MERGFGTCEVEWTGKVEIKKFLAEGGACMVIPGFKWRTFDNSGSSTEGTLISASTVPYCRVLTGKVYDLIIVKRRKGNVLTVKSTHMGVN